MNWFANNGDKLLALITSVAALAATQADSLHIPAPAIAWITFGAGAATLAHTLFYPNTGQTK